MEKIVMLTQAERDFLDIQRQKILAAFEKRSLNPANFDSCMECLYSMEAIFKKFSKKIVRLCDEDTEHGLAFAQGFPPSLLSEEFQKKCCATFKSEPRIIKLETQYRENLRLFSSSTTYTIKFSDGEKLEWSANSASSGGVNEEIRRRFEAKMEALKQAPPQLEQASLKLAS